jgi:hypothetical protein
LALIRAAALTTGIIANVEPDSLDLMVVVEQRPEIIRTIPLPQLILSPSISLDIIADEVYRTAKFYDDSHKEAPLPSRAPVILSGELPAELPIEAAIGERSGRPVLLGQVELDHSADFPLSAYLSTAGLLLKHGLGIRRRAA